MAIFKTLYGLFTRRWASERAPVVDRDKALSHKVSFETNLAHIVDITQGAVDLVHDVLFGTDLVHSVVMTQVAIDLIHDVSFGTDLTHDVTIARRE